MEGNDKDNTKFNPAALVLGSGSAGVLELALFHPVDTIAKRLMNNRTNVLSTRPTSLMFRRANEVIFKDASTKAIMKKYKSLFPGFGYALLYKIIQRIYKFAGQPMVNDIIWKKSDSLTEKVGDRYSKILVSAISGSLVGMSEVLLLPLDSIKVKLQTAPIPGTSALNLIKTEGIVGLYSGATWTVLRNVPGSFALFGVSSFTKEFIFKLENHKKATFYQDFTASVAGAISCIAISSPVKLTCIYVQEERAVT